MTVDGRYTATHFRIVLARWLIVAIGLGEFAPRVETALSGAAWQAPGSQSVRARNLINRGFDNLSSYALMTVVHSPTQTVTDLGLRAVLARVEDTLRHNGAVRTVRAPAPGISISRDGHTASVCSALTPSVPPPGSRAAGAAHVPRRPQAGPEGAPV